MSITFSDTLKMLNVGSLDPSAPRVKWRVRYIDFETEETIAEVDAPSEGVEHMRDSLFIDGELYVVEGMDVKRAESAVLLVSVRQILDG